MRFLPSSRCSDYADIQNPFSSFGTAPASKVGIIWRWAFGATWSHSQPLTRAFIAVGRKHGATHLSPAALDDLIDWVDLQLLAHLDLPPPPGWITPTKLQQITENHCGCRRDTCPSEG